VVVGIADGSGGGEDESGGGQAEERHGSRFLFF
jgi:hypothetical protein